MEGWREGPVHIMTRLHWISMRKKTADLKEMDDKVIDKLIMIIYLKCGITKAAAGLWFTSQHHHHIWEQCLICKEKKKTQNGKVICDLIQTQQKDVELVLFLLKWNFPRFLQNVFLVLINF